MQELLQRIKRPGYVAEILCTGIFFGVLYGVFSFHFINKMSYIFRIILNTSSKTVIEVLIRISAKFFEIATQKHH